jgi:hypothetical protein
MTASGEQLRYELGPGGCRRTVLARGDAAPRDDLFAIGEASKWNVDRRTGRLPLLAVTIGVEPKRNEPTASRLMPFLVCASLGADASAAVAANNESL